jgi:Alginate lyase
LAGQNRATRRTVLAAVLVAPLCLGTAAVVRAGVRESLIPKDHERAEKTRVLAGAKRWLGAATSTITDYPAPRSPGDKHAYYSEGDYWWPDPANPAGPYIRRDGLSNPNRFDDHRQALIRMAQIVPALTAGWLASGNSRFAAAAKAHLIAWFVRPETQMAPHLQHAQAIIGVNTGRGTGIIDTLHLAEVALAVRNLLTIRNLFDASEERRLRGWFKDYHQWLRTSVNGLDEGDEANNHGTCYVLQIAGFARLADANSELDWCRNRLRRLIDGQIAADGGQPLELARTKPFGYCLFNLDVLAGCAHLLSTPNEDLWRYRGTSGGSVESALACMAPYIADKSRWPHAKDIAYWDDWPVRHPALLFGGQALGRADYLELWGKLDADPQVPEIIRNFPIRQPLLWQ